MTVNDAREFQTETLPKNGPDALEMGCPYYSRKQISVSYAADCDLIVCYGGAKLTDKHLAATVHCVDDEIIAPLGSKPFLTVDIACATLWKIFAL